ncbi:hypothetical protein BH10BAC5_BH10BAC5_20260 [soil metagenome]
MEKELMFRDLKLNYLIIFLTKNKMKNIKIILTVIFTLIISFSAFSQNYDLRITQLNTSGTIGGTVDFLCEISASSGAYKLGGGNYVFTFNTLGVTGAGATLVNPNVSMNSGLWTPMTLTTPAGTRMSINTEYNGSAGSGLQLTAGVWTNLATVRMVIIDPTVSGNIVWRVITPSITNAFLDDNATLLSFGTFTGVNQLLPVELASFTSSVSRNNVKLDWQTASEINNRSFSIERKNSASEWSRIGEVQGNGTTTEIKNYKFDDRNLMTGKYRYRLKQIDNNGNFEYFLLQNEVEVGVPDKFELSQNYPNPFNPTTKINYDHPVDSKVSLKIYDMTGREITSLVNTFQTAGYYVIQFNASNMASGMYFYNIIAEGSGKNFVTTKKMVLVK